MRSGYPKYGRKGSMMGKTAIQLSDHLDYRKLLKFTLPSIAMMIFTSIYGVVDGFSVSNYAEKVRLQL